MSIIWVFIGLYAAYIFYSKVWVPFTKVIHTLPDYAQRYDKSSLYDDTGAARYHKKTSLIWTKEIAIGPGDNRGTRGLTPQEVEKYLTRSSSASKPPLARERLPAQPKKETFKPRMSSYEEQIEAQKEPGADLPEAESDIPEHSHSLIAPVKRKKGGKNIRRNLPKNMRQLYLYKELLDRPIALRK